jgi:hypothetical protein
MYQIYIVVAKGRQMIVTGVYLRRELCTRARATLLYSSQDMSLSINGKYVEDEEQDQASGVLKRGAEPPAKAAAGTIECSKSANNTLV